MSNNRSDHEEPLHHNDPKGDGVPLGDIRFDDNTEHGSKTVKVTAYGVKPPVVGQSTSVAEQVVPRQPFPGAPQSVIFPPAEFGEIVNVHAVWIQVTSFLSDAHVHTTPKYATYAAPSGQVFTGGVITAHPGGSPVTFDVTTAPKPAM